MHERRQPLAHGGRSCHRSAAKTVARVILIYVMMFASFKVATQRSLRACLSTQAAAPKQGEIVSFLTLNNLADNPGAVKKVSLRNESMVYRHASCAHVLFPLETPYWSWYWQ